jgi:hypothetical protein
MKNLCSPRRAKRMRRRWIVTTTTFLLLLLTLGATAFMQSAADPAARRRSADASPGRTTRIPLNNLKPLSNLSPEACANVIVDGGYETGGIPSSTWDPETSTNFGTPLCDVPSCGTGGGASPPRTGNFWAWYGGIPAPETATLGQTVPIAANSTATLNFWMRIGTVSSPFTDVLNVRVDGTIVQSFPEPTVAEGAYTLRTINLNAFANGANHAILFEYIGPTSGTGSYVIDDVTLDVCDLGVVIPPGKKFSTWLTPEQEVPTPTPFVSLTGSGLGRVTLNPAMNQITVSLSYTGLGSNAIAAHIHGSATSVPGQTAPIIFDLMPTGGTSGTNTATTFAITPAQVALLQSNLMYFNVHTVNNPNGEIRGQIHMNDPVGNFDSDGKTDAGGFRPSDNKWYIQRSSDGATFQPTWGLNTDTLVPGDYDGDGNADVAVWRNGIWHIRRSSDGTTYGSSWGVAGDIPVPCDYDMDGITDLAVFRPSTGDWFVMQSSNGVVFGVHWGANGDIPVPCDYDGDCKCDFAVFRPSDGTWYILNSAGGMMIKQFGLSTDIPVPGDYDGDGKCDIAVYRPSTNTWYICLSSNGTIRVQVWGASGDIPVPGDYDSDGRDDVAVFRPSDGKWYILKSLNNGLKVLTWGTNGDVPIPSLR